jgi:heme exporter protein CcmD
MSGYAAYVWSCVFLAMAMIAGNIWSAARALRSVRARVAVLQKSERK